MPPVTSRIVPLLACALALGCSHAPAPAAQHPTDGAAPAAAAAPVAEPPLATEDDKTLYALGMIIGRNISTFHLTPAELALVMRGARDQVQRTATLDLQVYGPKVNLFSRARTAAGVKAEKERSRGYIESAAADPGAEQLPSGVVFHSLRAGSGASPTAEDSVKASYRGTLIDGSEFDNSAKHEEPSVFPLRGVIPCWTEGLQKMKVGGRAQLICPSDTAYGDGGRPPTIPGGATLTFDIELLEIVPPSTPSAPAPEKTSAPEKTPAPAKKPTPAKKSKT